MLSKCVLCTPPRAGKQHANQRIAFTRQRLQRWLAGDRATLWRDIPNYTRKTQHDKSDVATICLRQSRCINLCGEGADSKACKSLTSEPLSDHSLATTRQMKKKHPTASGPIEMTPISPVNHGLVPTVDVDDIKAGSPLLANTPVAGLRVFARGTSNKP